ncbi:ubiquitin-like-conjugating enzyme ATG10 isoform X2 [Cornus florida]|uniref:ubiquitin-like-conjugating enzyme ATG10 isoform X2 n=1 Tax=Cornus florida TaxID=4283 RepID=UPI00289BB3FB|nr:ubiquitin-like-conjugating enzyme ATG10 isoform X2 [Cornus florida]
MEPSPHVTSVLRHVLSLIYGKPPILLCPQWSWVVPSPKLPLIAPHQEDHDEGSHTQKEEPSCSDQDEPIDSAILVKSCGGELHHYDFHIVYSTSYRVPVLYFRAYCSDGQPLVLDDFEKDLPANSVKAITESKWTFITQEVLNRHLPQLRQSFEVDADFVNLDWYLLMLQSSFHTKKQATFLVFTLVICILPNFDIPISVAYIEWPHSSE